MDDVESRRTATFQSTHLMRGVTSDTIVKVIILCPISIHAPHTRCDNAYKREKRYSPISIHAPHAGCDGASVDMQVVRKPFQSTHPMRGATPDVCPF